MKNFLSLDNLILEDKNSINNIIQSSSEVSDCSITNILEENSSLIWISNEELPQEITLNLSRSFLREYPKKISSIGIYCWHAYPTNPKLVEVLISKNDDKNFISFGNFDLCLKPGRQLLQLDEGDNNFLITENNNYIIKLIIKETYGDKRTYINNIYLYENIDFMASGIINTVNTFETIKEEDDSSSIFYLRESRERTLPRKKNNSVSNNNTNANALSNNNLNNFYNNNQKQSNMNKKMNSELNSKDLTIDEFEIITKTKVKDNKIVEKNKNNILVTNNTYDNDESNININTLGPESQYNGTYSEYSSKNNGIKNDDLSHRNILLTKTNDNLDNLDEELNNINNNLSKNKINEEENKKDNNNNFKKNGNNPESPDVSLSSDDLDTFGLLKGTKTHQKNFYIPPKMSEVDEELENLELQHSISGLKFKTNNDILNKKISDNYFSMSNNSNSTKKNMNKAINSQNNYNNKIILNNKVNFNKISNNDNNLNKINNNLEDFNKNKNLNYIEKNNNSIELNENNLNINDNKSNKSNDKSNIIDENKKDNTDEINKIKEEMSLLRNEFQNYRKEQEEIIKQYENKITNLESHIKRLQINSNKMNDVVKTLLEAQYIQNQTNNDFLLNQMRKIASETFANIFSNISQLANLTPSSTPSTPSITIQNQNQSNQSNQSRQTSIPSYNDNITNIKMYEDKTKRTYHTTRRKMYSIDKVHKQQNNSYSINYNISNNLNNNIINNNEEKNKINNNIYNRKFDDIKASRLKKYNSGRNIVLRKNYINQNNYINYDNQKYNANNNSIENNDNNGEEQMNGNLFYQTGYPTETNKNPFQRGKNINRNEILKINNNNFNNNILNDKKEIVHRRILTNCYKKKTFSPIKKSRHSYVVYTDSDHLFPETTVNAVDKNKNLNFNLNNNENENEENEETNSNDDDTPLKVSQLKTEKRNYNPNKMISNEKNNFDEEKENGDEINDNQNIGDTVDTFTNLQNKYEDKLIEEVKKDSNNKNQRYVKENIKTNEIKRNIGNADKIINSKRKKITVKNDSLISLIHKLNRNNKNKDVNNE